MRRLPSVAVALLLLLTLTACGRGGVRVIPSEELPARIYDPSAEAQQANFVLYFVEDGRLTPVVRTVRTSLPLEEIAMRMLLAGPGGDEQRQGIATAIPIATGIQNVAIEEGVARLDLTLDFFVGGSPVSQSGVLRLAQIVWTLTELREVNAVLFMESGRTYDVIDQDQQRIVGPVGRARYSDFQPPADPDEPTVGT